MIAECLASPDAYSALVGCAEDGLTLFAVLDKGQTVHTLADNAVNPGTWNGQGGSDFSVAVSNLYNVDIYTFHRAAQEGTFCLLEAATQLAPAGTSVGRINIVLRSGGGLGHYDHLQLDRAAQCATEHSQARAERRDTTRRRRLIRYPWVD